MFDFVSLRDDKDMIWRAQAYRLALGDTRYFAILRSEFSSQGRRPDELTSKLLSLGFDHFLTTNYDDLLERAMKRGRGGRKREFVCWEETERVADFITQLGKSGPKNQFLIYLHGRFDDPAKIVLSDSDYRDRYIENDRARKKLFAMFATKPIVFLGFSLEDPDFMLVFREVGASLVQK